jgi:hypothetical protein
MNVINNHFRLSKETKRVMATLSGNKKHEYKNLMIQAQASEIQNKQMRYRGSAEE